MHLLLYRSRLLHNRLQLMKRQILANPFIHLLKLRQQRHALRVYPLIAEVRLQILRQQHPHLDGELFNVGDHALLNVHADPLDLYMEVFEVLLVGRFQQGLDDILALVGLALVVVQFGLLHERFVDLGWTTFWFAWWLLDYLLLLDLFDVSAVVLIDCATAFAVFGISTILSG